MSELPHCHLQVRDGIRSSQREEDLEAALRETQDRLRRLERNGDRDSRDYKNLSRSRDFRERGVDDGPSHGQMEYLMMQINDLQSRNAQFQAENSQLRMSGGMPPGGMYGTPYMTPGLCPPPLFLQSRRLCCVAQILTLFCFEVDTCS